MSRLTVACGGGTDCRLGAVVASLPESLIVGGEPADLVEVHGAPGWPGRVRDALSSGVRGIMVVSPHIADATGSADRPAGLAEDIARLAAEADGADVPVVVDSRWAANPALANAAEAFAGVVGADSLVRCRVDAAVDSDLEAVLLEQLALVRTAVGEADDLSVVRRTDRGYDMRGALPTGASVALTAVLSDALAPGADISVIEPSARVDVRIVGPETAEPASVRVSDETGERLLPHRHESGHRAAWRRLHELASVGRACDDLAGLARDLTAIAAAS